ncbi:MAG: VIT1/CCC1 transporter family protein [Betaproteobacteria bacterium]|nr:VIT1/CCC1 transporter family protein [Betaproteobacteria bacterium]
MSGSEHSLEGWREEKRSAYLYRAMAEAEAGTPRAELFRGLAVEAENQAGIWARLASAGVTEYAPDLRARMVAALVRRYGPRPLRSVLVAMKVRGLSVYSHAAPGHPLPTTLEEVGKRHRGVSGGGNLRAAVFGVNDGLVSNASLILGVAGASANNSIILLSGVAGLLAGAFSMAAGEYVSVRSQREMFEHQIGLERDELAQYPEEEAEELALIYAARGLAREDALKLAKAIIADPAQALDTLAREELGLNPEELGSPWGAAIFSFLSFAAGALAPLLPFLALGGDRALPASIGITALALFAVGAAISLFTGRSALRDGLRMLAIGAAAGGLTYAIGRMLGVSLS